MKNKNKLANKITIMKEKLSSLRGKLKAHSETHLFNRPRRDKTVRSGKTRNP